jgi:hypothetical protein
MTIHFPSAKPLAVAAAVIIASLSTIGSSIAAEAGAGLKLTGDQEVPAVTTSATGTGNISVAPDGSVSGSVNTTGLAGTMAHIHMAGPGKNGPVIVPLVKTSEGMWSVAPGAKLSAEQLKAYQAGELYVNVHTEANKGGEIRAQLKP